MYIKKTLLLAELQAQLVGEAHCELANKRENALPAMLSCAWGFHPGPGRCQGAGTASCPPCLPAPGLWSGSGGKRRGCRAVGSLQSFLVHLVLLVYTPGCLVPPLFWEACSLPARLHGDTGGCGWPNLRLRCFPQAITAGLQESFYLTSF